MPHRDRSTWEVGRALDEARGESTAFETRMRRLAATACDTTRDDETRLKALMTINAEVHRRRSARRDSATGEDDKISTAKKAAHRAELVREKAERIAAGNNRIWKISGTMHTADQPDAVACTASHKRPNDGHSHHCVVCGAGFTPAYKSFQRGRPALYCGHACRQRAHRAREDLRPIWAA